MAAILSDNPGLAPDEDLTLPLVLGTYRLFEKIGDGGTGVVYRAERADGQFEKQVAVKLMRAGALTPNAVKRFLNQRQILATLDHPHIARMLDGGMAGDGRPYIVMEHVDGLAIDLYCRDRKPGMRETVLLFEKVCAALEYAHRHGVIHRDIKPGHVLVTRGGAPKLLDSLWLDRAAAPGPDSAIPEQLPARASTPASEVYSLGVLLYECLTGERPAGNAAFSARVASRDLDAIVRKALACDPAGRYASGEELRQDLERYLQALPVAARPRAVSARIAEFVRRHRWQMATAAIAATAIVSLALLVRYNQQRTRERRTQTVAAVVSLFHEMETRIAATPHSTEARRRLFQSMRRELDVLEPDAGDDSEVLYNVALGYCRLGRAEAGYSGSVGDFGSALETFERARAVATRAARRSREVRDKQLLVYILQAVAVNALGANRVENAVSAVAEGSRLLEDEGPFRRKGMSQFVREYRICFALLEAHTLQARNRMAESLSLWLRIERDVAALPDGLRSPDMRLFLASEARLRLAEHYCWSGEPGLGAKQAAAGLGFAAQYSALVHDSTEERALQTIVAICQVQLNQPDEALRILAALKREYTRDLDRQPDNYSLRSSVANCDRYLGDAFTLKGDLPQAAEAYREGLSLVQSPADFAGSPNAERRAAEILARLGHLEMAGAGLRHLMSACAYYKQAAAIFERRKSGVLYVEDRAALAEAEGALPACSGMRPR